MFFGDCELAFAGLDRSLTRPVSLFAPRLCRRLLLSHTNVELDRADAAARLGGPVRGADEVSSVYEGPSKFAR